MKIEIVIDAQGKATVETKGFARSSCRDASRFVELALGQRTGEKLTAEFYQGRDVEQRNRQHI